MVTVMVGLYTIIYFKIFNGRHGMKVGRQGYNMEADIVVIR